MIETKKTFQDYIEDKKSYSYMYCKYGMELTMTESFNKDLYKKYYSEICDYVTQFYYQINIKYNPCSNKIIYTWWTD